MRRFLIIIFCAAGLKAHALQGLETLGEKLLEKNSDYLSLKEIAESKNYLKKSQYSAFYPTLSAVGGWEQQKVDNPLLTEKGYIGYIEGKASIFRGFRDSSLIDAYEAEYKLALLDADLKKRELKQSLTEVISDMIYLHKVQEILNEEYKVTVIQRQMAAKKVAGGLTGSVDNLEFDLRENELQTEQKQIDQLHVEAHQKLLKLFSQDLQDSDLEKIDFGSPDELTKRTKTFQIEDNPDFQKAELQRIRTEMEKNGAKSDFFPSVDVFYNFGRLTPSEESSLRLDESKYGITLTIPLFTGLDSYFKTKAYNQQLSAAEKLKEQKRVDAQSEYEILKTKGLTFLNLYQINEKKLENSKKYFDLTLSEYRRGVKNSPDLVTATERWFGSQKRKYELLKELELVSVKLDNLN